MDENYEHLYEQTKKMLTMYQDELVPDCGWSASVQGTEQVLLLWCHPLDAPS